MYGGVLFRAWFLFYVTNVFFCSLCCQFSNNILFGQIVCIMYIYWSFQLTLIKNIYYILLDILWIANICSKSISFCKGIKRGPNNFFNSFGFWNTNYVSNLHLLTCFHQPAAGAWGCVCVCLRVQGLLKRDLYAWLHLEASVGGGDLCFSSAKGAPWAAAAYHLPWIYENCSYLV